MESLRSASSSSFENHKKMSSGNESDAEMSSPLPVKTKKIKKIPSKELPENQDTNKFQSDVEMSAPLPVKAKKITKIPSKELPENQDTNKFQSDVEMSAPLPVKAKKITKIPSKKLLEKQDIKKLQSDVEMSAPLQVKVKKVTKKPSTDTELPEKQETKKMSTKEMVHKALSESKSRKGISLYAIKKYMHDNYSVDIEKINYLIKKNIKESVEAGSIIQTKGVGASGSFRLAPGDKSKKPLKKPKKAKMATEKEEQSENPKKSSSKSKERGSKPVKAKKNEIIGEAVKDASKATKKSKVTIEEPKASSMRTPKKRSKDMMKRRSIGSIIKPPKMKPTRAK